jgi:hypothetical protein
MGRCGVEGLQHCITFEVVAKAELVSPFIRPFTAKFAGVGWDTAGDRLCTKSLFFEGSFGFYALARVWRSFKRPEYVLS